MLSMRDPDVGIVQFELKMCGSRREEYIKTRKSELLLFWSYLRISALKSPCMFSEVRVSRGLLVNHC